MAVNKIHNDALNQDFYNKEAIDAFVAATSAKFKEIDRLGLYVGIFETPDDLPEFSEISEGDKTAKVTIKDFATVVKGGENESPHRYVVTAVDDDTGELSWEQDIVYAIDVDTKMDLGTKDVAGNVSVFDENGNKVTDGGADLGALVAQANANARNMTPAYDGKMTKIGVNSKGTNLYYARGDHSHPDEWSFKQADEALVPWVYQSYGTFTDPRDGKIYPWRVMPDGKKWMTVNLDYNQSGSMYMPTSGTGTTAGKNPPFANAGRLYSWNEAVAACNGLPFWHLPTDEEWTALLKAAGGTGTFGETGKAGSALKSKITGDAIGQWKYSSGNGGLDTYGFTALPCGRWLSGIGFGVNLTGFFMSNSKYYRHINFSTTVVERVDLTSSSDLRFSVRCVHD